MLLLSELLHLLDLVVSCLVDCGRNVTLLLHELVQLVGLVLLRHLCLLLFVHGDLDLSVPGFDVSLMIRALISGNDFLCIQTLDVLFLLFDAESLGHKLLVNLSMLLVQIFHPLLC